MTLSGVELEDPKRFTTAADVELAEAEASAARAAAKHAVLRASATKLRYAGGDTNYQAGPAVCRPARSEPSPPLPPRTAVSPV